LKTNLYGKLLAQVYWILEFCFLTFPNLSKFLAAFEQSLYNQVHMFSACRFICKTRLPNLNIPKELPQVSPIFLTL
jgi:hypothetical protein